MRGLGTLINTAAVLLGGAVGLCLKSGLKQKYQDILTCACGLPVIFIGAAGTLQGMLKITDGKIETQGSMLLIISLVIGGLLGELLGIERRLDSIGEKLKSAVKVKNDGRFVEGFVNASLIICVGAMAIVGSIQDGLLGDSSMLMAKSVLDGIIVMVLASSCGVGAVFSALPLFIYQGAITLLAMLVGSFIGEALIAELSYVGAALVCCVGINLVFGKKVKVGNFLPALLVPVAYEIIKSLI